MWKRKAFPKVALAASLFTTAKARNIFDFGPSPRFSLLPTTELTPSGTPAPCVKHVRKLRRDLTRKLLIVGDVHGCLDELKLLIKVVKSNHPEPLTVIMAGDLVNKGPKSPEVLDFCEENGYLSVRGNHDDASLEAVFRVGRYENHWKEKWEWTTLLNEKHIEFLSSLPYSIRIEDTSPPIIVVHAGLIPGIELEKQDFYDLLSIRYIVERNGTYRGVEKTRKDSDNVNWAEIWDGPEFVFYGHDAVRGLNEKHYSLGLDTSVVYGKKLTGAVVEIQDDGRWTYELVEVSALNTWWDVDKKAKAKL